MSNPQLLDLFSGAGGAARGYQQAGFHVTGVDCRPQPRYAGDAFVQADALEYLAAHGREYDAIHASPPCQRYSAGSRNWNGKPLEYSDLVGPCRQLLAGQPAPWIIENVMGSPLGAGVVLCGVMFGLRVFRHRVFEASFVLLAPPHPPHRGSTGSHRGYRTARSGRGGYVCVAGHNYEARAGALAMGIDWMGPRRELSQAVPPAYTEYLGAQLRRVVESCRA